MWLWLSLGAVVATAPSVRVTVADGVPCGLTRALPPALAEQQVACDAAGPYLLELKGDRSRVQVRLLDASRVVGERTLRPGPDDCEVLPRTVALLVRSWQSTPLPAASPPSPAAEPVVDSSGQASPTVKAGRSAAPPVRPDTASAGLEAATLVVAAGSQPATVELSNAPAAAPSTVPSALGAPRPAAQPLAAAGLPVSPAADASALTALAAAAVSPPAVAAQPVAGSSVPGPTSLAAAVSPPAVAAQPVADSSVPRRTSPAAAVSPPAVTVPPVADSSALGRTSLASVVSPPAAAEASAPGRTSPAAAVFPAAVAAPQTVDMSVPGPTSPAATTVVSPAAVVAPTVAGAPPRTSLAATAPEAPAAVVARPVAVMLAGGGALAPADSAVAQGSLGVEWQFFKPWGAALDAGLESSRTESLAPGSVSAWVQWAGLSAVRAFHLTERAEVVATLGGRLVRVQAHSQGYTENASTALFTGAIAASAEWRQRLTGGLFVLGRLGGQARFRPQAFEVPGVGTVLTLPAWGFSLSVGLGWSFS